MKFNQDYFIEEFQNLIIKDNFLSNNSKLFCLTDLSNFRRAIVKKPYPYNFFSLNYIRNFLYTGNGKILQSSLFLLIFYSLLLFLPSKKMKVNYVEFSRFNFFVKSKYFFPGTLKSLFLFFITKNINFPRFSKKSFRFFWNDFKKVFFSLTEIYLFFKKNKIKLSLFFYLGFFIRILCTIRLSNNLYENCLNLHIIGSVEPFQKYFANILLKKQN